LLRLFTTSFLPKENLATSLLLDNYKGEETTKDLNSEEFEHHHTIVSMEDETKSDDERNRTSQKDGEGYFVLDSSINIEDEWMDWILMKQYLGSIVVELNTKDKFSHIEIMWDEEILKDPLDPFSFTNFIRNTPGLSKTLVGQYLGNPGKEDLDGGRVESMEFHDEVLRLFIESFDFKDLSLLQSLRTFLTSFHLPGEAQQIDRILTIFAPYVSLSCMECQTGLFSTEDVTLLLSFAIIMLNTNLHNPSLSEKSRMSLEDFILQNSNYGNDISKGKTLPREYLIEIYNSIGIEQISCPDSNGIVKITKHYWDDLCRRDLDCYPLHLLGFVQAPPPSYQRINEREDEDIYHEMVHKLFWSSYSVNLKYHSEKKKMIFSNIWRDGLILAVSCFLPLPPTDTNSISTTWPLSYDPWGSNPQFGLWLNEGCNLPLFPSSQSSSSLSIQLGIDLFLILVKLSSFHNMQEALDLIILVLSDSTNLLMPSSSYLSITLSMKEKLLSNHFSPSFLNHEITGKKQQEEENDEEIISPSHTPSIELRDTSSTSSSLNLLSIDKSEVEIQLSSLLTSPSRRAGVVCLLTIAREMGSMISTGWIPILMVLCQLMDMRVLPDEFLCEVSTDPLIPPDIQRNLDIWMRGGRDDDESLSGEEDDEIESSGFWTWVDWLSGGDEEEYENGGMLDANDEIIGGSDEYQSPHLTSVSNASLVDLNDDPTFPTSQEIYQKQSLIRQMVRRCKLHEMILETKFFPISSLSSLISAIGNLISSCFQISQPGSPSNFEFSPSSSSSSNKKRSEEVDDNNMIINGMFNCSTLSNESVFFLEMLFLEIVSKNLDRFHHLVDVVTPFMNPCALVPNLGDQNMMISFTAATNGDPILGEFINRRLSTLLILGGRIAAREGIESIHFSSVLSQINSSQSNHILGEFVSSSYLSKGIISLGVSECILQGVSSSNSSYMSFPNEREEEKMEIWRMLIGWLNTTLPPFIEEVEETNAIYENRGGNSAGGGGVKTTYAQPLELVHYQSIKAFACMSRVFQNPQLMMASPDISKLSIDVMLKIFRCTSRLPEISCSVLVMTLHLFDLYDDDGNNENPSIIKSDVRDQITNIQHNLILVLFKDDCSI